ncbi:hypothetical protein EZV62_026341 [Acer yangbiense]|uniref:Retroviral polymerase SH3-like domain-containing protein n=1 Tax=Acer yangbiense TaxID=1000413 RepID=A0A5C7GRG7_9ROSI|nr:hypothetical protein EZV62_026341 [Acer yangbiense]
MVQACSHVGRSSRSRVPWTVRSRQGPPPYLKLKAVLFVARELEWSMVIGPFPSSFGEKAKVKVRVQLNLHGIVNVQSASLISESMDDSETRRDASSTSEVHSKSDHTLAVANDDEVKLMSSAGKDDSAVSPSPESTTGKEQGSSTKKDARSREMSSSSLGNLKSTNQSGHPLGSYCSVKLNHENYLLWKNLVLPVIRGNRLEGFITGTRKCPPKYVPAIVSEEVSDEAQENPEHEEWVVQDQILLGCETSKDLWDSIKDLFGIKTKSNIAYYKKEFQELKKGGMKMSDYLKMAKRLIDNLALAGRPVPLEDLVSQILNGLDSHEYNPLVCQINEKEDISWIDLQAKLLSYEKRLEQMNAGISSINLGQATANFVGTKNIGGTQEAMETEVVDSQEEKEAETVTLGLFAKNQTTFPLKSLVVHASLALDLTKLKNFSSMLPNVCFLGYSDTFKGYKCVSSTGRIYISRHVVFNELEFPFKDSFLNTKQAESTTVINARHWFPTLFPPPQTTPTDTSPSSSCPSSSTSPLHVSSTSGSLPANSPAILVEGGNDDDDASSNPSPNLSDIPYGSDNSIEEESGYEEITDVQPTEGQGHHMMTRAKMA